MKSRRVAARADLGIVYIQVVTTKPQVSILVFIQIKKLCLSKIRLKIEKNDGGVVWLYTFCGLDIRCGWGVEMCDI